MVTGKMGKSRPKQSVHGLGSVQPLTHTVDSSTHAVDPPSDARVATHAPPPHVPLCTHLRQLDIDLSTCRPKLFKTPYLEIVRPIHDPQFYDSYHMPYG